MPPADRGEFVVDKYQGTSLLLPFPISIFINLGHFMLASTTRHVCLAPHLQLRNDMRVIYHSGPFTYDVSVSGVGQILSKEREVA